ncbi:hypothetical protein FQ192_10615 [Pseudomonas sp. ANT_J12]|uniref:hypothetical protein n=1 Tax=Pseudomonas sp. ANT_J12 TaxID=2597351 RepID=UPI0011F2240B|nr:hypothetical protein [Pseudomonas sp. ANT_J12]KAA0995482.1 hypothetical protein FQ192_10615 [Pseudomonas sp. ANT_J12]
MIVVMLCSSVDFRCRLIEAASVNLWNPASLLATGRGIASSVLASCPLLIAGLAGVFGVGFELPTHSVKQHLFAVDHRSLQHARYSSKCPD